MKRPRRGVDRSFWLALRHGRGRIAAFRP